VTLSRECDTRRVTLDCDIHFCGMDSSSLIDSRVSIEQCKKAVSALLTHVRDKQQKLDETELLPDKEQHVWLVVTVKRMQPMKNLKPQKM
jgi:ribosome biogenesis protein UTP30